METHKIQKDTKNWLRLNLLADQACVLLRNLFKKIWAETFKHEWDATQAVVILSQQNVKNVTKTQRQMIEEANIDNWDITLLKTILVTPDLLCMTNMQMENIIKISKIRNELSHHPTKFVPNSQFSTLWMELEQSLINLGASENELEQLKQEQRRGGVEFVPEEEEADYQNQVKALKLKEKGNSCFKKGDFSEAIRHYTKAIGLSGIPSAQRAFLFANRCLTYVKSHEKTHGKNDSIMAQLVLAEADAKKAVELSPNWGKGYFRLGQIYLAMGKFEKAEDHLNEALAKQPKNKDILHALSNTRLLRSQKECIAYFDPRDVPQTAAEVIQEMYQKTGENLNVDSFKEFLSSKVDSVKLQNAQDCYIGHCYATGTDGYPLDGQLAAQHYRKAIERGSAEAMLNLGCKMVQGDGVKQDFDAGIKLLKEAASQPPIHQNHDVNRGVAESENALAIYYAYGIGVTKDLGEAIYWYQRSSKNGCSSASNNLGSMYEHGIIDGKPDLVKAEQYYYMASRSGLKPGSFAMFNLARMYAHKGKPDKALAWCRRAKENGFMNPCVDKFIQNLSKEIECTYGEAFWESTTNVATDSLTTEEYHGCFFCDAAPHLAATAPKHKIPKTILEKICSWPTIELNSTNVTFTHEEIFKCRKTSSYGQHLWTAKQHSLAALDILNKFDDQKKVPPMEDCEKFIAHFSAGAQLEFMVFELSPQLRSFAMSIVEQLLKQDTHFDEDVRVCYVSLQDASSAKLTISFLNNCIQNYPKNLFFHNMRAKLNALLGHYENSVLDANTVLKLCPNDWESLFLRAQMMHRAGPVFSLQASINAYKQFIEVAPTDHWKTPEAFYSIAHLIIFTIISSTTQLLSTRLESSLITMKHYYFRGQAAEIQQLPFFWPYASKIKIILENFFAEITGMLGPSVDVTAGVKPKIPESHEAHKKLSDPYRIFKITQHRRYIEANLKNDLWSMNCSKPEILQMGKNCIVEIPIPFTPPKQQPPLESLANLKSIFLEDMDPTKDFIYEGCALEVTVIDEIDFSGPSVSIVVEDKNGHVERCFIYNFPALGDFSKCRKEFGPGCQVNIINPYMRMTKDGLPAIRVDDPIFIIHTSVVHNMCRYCCMPNAPYSCEKCKMALYCSEECTKLDAEELHHGLICL